jgi:hypothetical protein
MEHQKWVEIVDAMIEAFKLLIIEEDTSERWLMTDTQWKQKSKNKQKKINYGLRMFIKYYGNLWY